MTNPIKQLSDMKMDVFDKSKYAKSKENRNNNLPRLRTWISSRVFDADDEKYLVDLPDYLPDGHFMEQFAKDLCQKYNKYGKEMFLSDKQVGMLNELIGRYCT